MKKIIFILCLTVTFAFFAQKSEANQITVWGGYNFASSDMLDAMDILARIGGIDVTKGGFTAGADLWMGDKLQFGVGSGYISFFALEVGTLDASLALVPIMAQLRFFVTGGFHVGGGVGYLFGVTKYEDNGVSQDDDSINGSSFGIEALVGYDITLTDSVVLNLGCRLYIGFDDETLINVVPSGGIGLRF
ncbi:MAG: outer membrane beta-barrel protein [bacterium]|nr:outer membrane beta-barrel protein [bacterium]